MSENLVKKPKKEDTFDDEDDEIEESDSSSSSNVSDSDLARKRLVRMMGLIMGVTVVLLLFIYIISLFSHKNYTYIDVENIMVDASKKYFAEPANSQYLPAEEGKIAQLDATNLIYGGYMKDFSSYGMETCSGNVQVEKIGTEYVYTPYLNCGGDYATVNLYNKILSDNQVVTSGYGLYKMNNSYVFRGESVNNYVQLDNDLWRIVKVNNDNTVVLISQEGLHYSQAWDDRYNDSKLYGIGINTYGTSRVKEYLNRVYTNPSEKDQEEILSTHDKSKIVSYSMCIGKRNPNSSVNNNSEECTEKSNNTKLGLLTLSDYLNASIDPNCKNSTNKSCLNYNYLVIDSNWWLVTANKENNYTAFMVNDNGAVELGNTSQYGKIRPVIYLSDGALYDEGKGTLEEPYKIR